ncbi:unnamed protein product [Urochloa decumbens]|uniref:Uncharacterized protein n=1 Tax=Urochloa decumbens TaxID=240449 RepID=A0ABC9ASC1_9POAL
MKRRHLPPVLGALLLLALSLLSLSSRRRHHLLLPRGPPSQHAAEGGDALLRRLAAADAGGDQILAEAAALLANASVFSFPSIGNRYRLLYLRLPYRANATAAPRQRAVSRLRVPFVTVPDDAPLLAAFRASLRSFLLARRRGGGEAGDDVVTGGGVAMGGLAAAGLLGRAGKKKKRFPTCAVVGNSGILLGAGHGPQIDAHTFIIRLNNARIAGYAGDVGTRTSLSFVNSNILHRCAARSATTTPGGCDCHPYGRGVPLAMYVSQPAHLLDALICNATATPPTSPFPLLVTAARLDAVCARVAKYYSMRRFVAATGEPASNWTRRHDERYFHYSSGLQAVVMALRVCDELSLFGFGKAPGARHHYHTNQKKELDLHDYEAEYQFYRDLQERPETVPFLDKLPGFKVPTVKLYW